MRHSEKSEYELISELAHRIYQQEGCPEGQAETHWRRAERALQLLRLSDAPASRGSISNPPDTPDRVDA